MSEREKLVEIMARAALANSWKQARWDRDDSDCQVYMADTRAALAAAEAAGWVITEPDDGR